MRFPTGGTARKPRGMIRCDSGADSIWFLEQGRACFKPQVWMGEDRSGYDQFDDDMALQRLFCGAFLTPGSP